MSKVDFFLRPPYSHFDNFWFRADSGSRSETSQETEGGRVEDLPQRPDLGQRGGPDELPQKLL